MNFAIASCILQLYFAFCNNRTFILQQAHNSKLQVSSFLSHSNCVKKCYRIHHDKKSVFHFQWGFFIMTIFSLFLIENWMQNKNILVCKKFTEFGNIYSYIIYRYHFPSSDNLLCRWSVLLHVQQNFSDKAILIHQETCPTTCSHSTGG